MELKKKIKKKNEKRGREGVKRGDAVSCPQAPVYWTLFSAHCLCYIHIDTTSSVWDDASIGATEGQQRVAHFLSTGTCVPEYLSSPRCF